MKNFLSKHSSTVLRAILIFSFILPLSAVLTGCTSNTDKPAIKVCNFDNYEYKVKLHWDADGSVADEFTLGEAWDLLDLCDEFENVDEGRYYITIYEDGKSAETDRSNRFYVGSGEVQELRIDDAGNIRGDHESDDEPTITVCNFDNYEYRVKLRRNADRSIVEEFTLGEAWDVLDFCNDFEDIPEGEYYITVHEDNDDDDEKSRSETFYIENEEHRKFEIDDTGSIKE